MIWTPHHPPWQWQCLPANVNRSQYIFRLAFSYLLLNNIQVVSTVLHKGFNFIDVEIHHWKMITLEDHQNCSFHEFLSKDVEVYFGQIPNEIESFLFLLEDVLH